MSDRYSGDRTIYDGWRLWRPEEKTAVFIDGANFYQSARLLGLTCDYGKLLDFLRQRTSLLRVYYFTTVPRLDSGPVGVKRLLDYLEFNGFDVIVREGREYSDSKGVPRLKGNMNIHLAYKVADLLSSLEHVILFTGDGDFVPVVERAKDAGVRVSVVSTLGPMDRAQPMVSDDLRRAADVYCDLRDMRKHIERPDVEVPYEEDDDMSDAGVQAVLARGG